MDAMLVGGAQRAIAWGWGEPRDRDHIEENGVMAGARPDYVSPRAKERQRREMGTLGSRHWEGRLSHRRRSLLTRM
jgi:tRNA-splicing ligase RtcB